MATKTLRKSIRIMGLLLIWSFILLTLFDVPVTALLMHWGYSRVQLHNKGSVSATCANHRTP